MSVGGLRPLDHVLRGGSRDGSAGRCKERILEVVLGNCLKLVHGHGHLLSLWLLLLLLNCTQAIGCLD